MNKPDSGRTPHPIEHAKSRTDKVQEELEIAGAELHLTHTTLENSLPVQQKKGDVKKALDHTATVEKKINAAAEELDEVTELLAEEVAQRHELELELARRPR
jgi:hypothetical protein